MSFAIITQIILFGIALSMDAFAVSVTDGLIYNDLNKKRFVFIASTFAIMQALMPLFGYWFVEIITSLIDEQKSIEVTNIISLVVTWMAFSLLILIGIKMIVESIIDIKKTKEEKLIKNFSIKEVLLMGIVTSIDALATGFALHAGISDNATIWLHVAIIMIITFIICFIGILLAHQIHKLLKGKYQLAQIIGGLILIALAIWIVLSHYFF